VYIIGPEEAEYEGKRSVTSFDVDGVMEYLKTAVLTTQDANRSRVAVPEPYPPNLDNFRAFLKHRVKQAGVYVNKRDFSAVSGILYSVSVISGIGKFYESHVISEKKLHLRWDGLRSPYLSQFSSFHFISEQLTLKQKLGQFHFHRGIYFCRHF
jgi:hypothetical protein